MTVRATGLVLVAVIGIGSASLGQSGEPIQPLDLIEIRVAEEPSLDLERQVDEAGELLIPVLGGVAIAGLTPTEAAAKLEAALEANLLQHATVTLTVREFRSPVPVTGAVATPGPVALGERLTLREALAAAGGPRPTAGPVVRIERLANNGLTDSLEVELTALDSGDPDLDLPLQARDRVHVPPASRVTVLLMGEIGRKGELTFEANERATILTAIARAGGLGERASQKLLIRRQQPDGGLQEIMVRFKQIMAAEAPDVPLQDGDIIIVKESFF